MSEIPFVKALGDEIERSAAERIASRRRRMRRRITLGALGFAVAATGVAAASGVLWNSPEQLASTGIACYEKPTFDVGASVLSTGDETPLQTCRRVLKTDAPLVACAGEGVHVFPGGPGTCRKLGLRPLPAAYTTARAKVVALERAVTEIERSGCVPIDEFARRVQALLDRTPGWEGWKVDVREDIADGPCGTVTAPGGDGSRSIDGMLNGEKRTVIVFETLPRELEDLLYSPHGLVSRLQDASSERCYDIAELEDIARARLAAAHLPLTFSVTAPPSADIEIEGAQGDRFAEGCPIIVGVTARDNGRELVVEIWD
jgi:hypothetical protein